MFDFPGNLTRLRNDTPGCKHVLHFNNAGAALPTQPMLDAVVAHLQQEAMIGGYEAARQAHEAVEHVYDAIAALIHCHREEVACVENATRAWDMAFYSIPFKPGDRILTSVAEYASNYIAFLQIARKTGVSVEAIPNDESGQVSVQVLRNLLDKRVKLIAITHVPTNGGLVNPAVEIGKVAREAGVLYLLDACQSVGQMPIDVSQIGCDMLSATGRKYLRGPRGTGFLYVRQEVLNQLEPPFLDLHAATWASREHFDIRSDARRFENWETYVAGKIGLGVAVEYALKLGVEHTYPRILTLANQLRNRLKVNPKVQIHDIGKDQCGIVTFTIEGVPSNSIQELLSSKQINVSVTTPNHTLLDSEARKLPNMVRASVHYYNSEEEVDRFGAIIEQIAEGRY